jgi:hypothetical protein
MTLSEYELVDLIIRLTRIITFRLRPGLLMPKLQKLLYIILLGQIVDSGCEARTPQEPSLVPVTMRNREWVYTEKYMMSRLQ